MVPRLAALLALLGLAGCPTSSPRPAAGSPLPCETASDCSAGWVCLAGSCADPRARALVADPANAVTPEKVKREVERIQQREEEGIDRAMKRSTE